MSMYAARPKRLLPAAVLTGRVRVLPRPKGLLPGETARSRLRSRERTKKALWRAIAVSSRCGQNPSVLSALWTKREARLLPPSLLKGFGAPAR